MDEDQGEVGLSDRALLRWACREGLRCAVSLPGRESWGRSFFVDLREGGPRPQLVIAQPTDLQRSGRDRPLRSGESVRVWSVRDGRPWHLAGFVAGVRMMETRESGPVEAALVQLPYRLLETDHQLHSLSSVGAPRAVVRVEAMVGEEQGMPASLLETWLDMDGEWLMRGGGYLVDLSRRSFSYSVPTTSQLVMLPGTQVRLEFRLPDLRLRTEVTGVVSAVMDFGGQFFQGLSLGRPSESISDEEHRETIRLVAATIP